MEEKIMVQIEELELQLLRDKARHFDLLVEQERVKKELQILETKLMA